MLNEPVAADKLVETIQVISKLKPLVVFMNKTTFEMEEAQSLIAECANHPEIIIKFSTLFDDGDAMLAEDDQLSVGLYKTEVVRAKKTGEINNISPMRRTGLGRVK